MSATSPILCSCGHVSAFPFVHTTRVVTNVLTGAFRWVQWSSCPACNQADERRWAEQRRDEEREREQREQRSVKAKERDQARVERQRKPELEVGDA